MIFAVLISYLSVGLNSPVAVVGGLIIGWLWHSRLRVVALLWCVATPWAASTLYVYQTDQMVGTGITQIDLNDGHVIAYVGGMLFWAAVAYAVSAAIRRSRKS